MTSHQIVIPKPDGLISFNLQLPIGELPVYLPISNTEWGTPVPAELLDLRKGVLVGTFYPATLINENDTVILTGEVEWGDGPLAPNHDVALKAIVHTTDVDRNDPSQGRVFLEINRIAVKSSRPILE